MSMDRYRTLGTEGTALYREKASRFLAWAFPIADEAAFKLRVDAIAKEHHASRHVCYAWVLGADGQPCGQVVLAAPAPRGGVDLLVESQVAAVQAGGLTAGGVALEMGSLPYALPA